MRGLDPLPLQAFDELFDRRTLVDRGDRRTLAGDVAAHSLADAPCRAGDRDRRVLTHTRANLVNERGDDGAPPIEKGFKLAVATCVGEPEGFRHVGREIDVAPQIGAHIFGYPAPQSLSIDAGGPRTLHAV